MNSIKDDMNIVIVGHVDHGKSTIIGRMLADTNSLPEGKLEQVKNNCYNNSKPFEYAFLLDALKDEQDQGITIDAARVFFQTTYRQYIIIDAPGHIEFLKNMVTGASRAEAALLVIDANEGIKENSKRHGYLLSMLGIKQISVLINKMDLVDYDEKVYMNIVEEYSVFLKQIDIKPVSFIPVSGREGDNIASQSSNMGWYSAKTVLDTLDSFHNVQLPEKAPFRMPVQDVYKFTNYSDNRRIVAGTIESGCLKIGDRVVFYPSGKTSVVKSLEGFNKKDLEQNLPGEAIGFTLEEQIFITRGELACLENEKKPKISAKLEVNLFWLSRDPLVKNKDYYLKLGTKKVKAKLEKIIRIVDATDLSNTIKEKVERHDVAECILVLEKAIAFDIVSDFDKTSRFVLVDNFEIAGGGIITKEIKDEETWVREKVLQRNFKWVKSKISQEERAEKYNQKPTLIIITGDRNTGKKPLAKALEKKLFDEGKKIYFMGIGNILYGVNADIKKDHNIEVLKEEHLRRLAEVSYLMLDAGNILIVTAVNLTNDNLKIFKTALNPENIKVILIGDRFSTDLEHDLSIVPGTNINNALNQTKTFMQNEGIIFKPW